MAFSLSGRFPPPPKSYNLLDPGAYQNTIPPLLQNKVPFLSTCSRNTQAGITIWTHALYNANLPPKIPNCTSLMSKVPRFRYEALSKEDTEAIMFQCGVENPCECSIEEDKEEIICQAKVRRRLFKGLAPKSTLGEGLSTPSKKDHGFKVLPNGTKIRLFQSVKEDSPPFYDARIIESSAFYQGCKWSQWTSRREQNVIESRPGPADYTIVHEPNYESLCAEKIRALKRKVSKQYRFIEMVQRNNIREGKPGPADYTPNYPKGTEMSWLGSKAERFADAKYEVRPSPNNYFIKRDFDKIDPPQKTSHVKLASPAFFGMKSKRFKPLREEGPSPASYDICYRPCHTKFCNTVPFGSSSQRFKEQIIEEDEDDDDINFIDGTPKTSDKRSVIEHSCEKPTWVFKSKTIGLKPSSKKFNEPSPADLGQSHVEIKRSRQLQYSSPFFTSEGRFRPWYNWVIVHGKENTPGPAYYCLDKPKCIPAVTCGPMFRTRRFPVANFHTPAPNTYRVGGGIETILSTHNQKLKDNIKIKHNFHWSPHVKLQKLTFEAQEANLLNKSIALLEECDNSELSNKIVKKSTYS